jgi:hypothetical protein
MSAWYSLSGSIQVCKCPEAEAVIARLRDHRDGGIEVDVNESAPGILEVSLGGGALISGDCARDYDELIQSLGPYVAEPAIVETVYESESCELVVAWSEVEATETLSRHRLDQIELLPREVTPEDRARLAERLQAPRVPSTAIVELPSSS